MRQDGDTTYRRLHLGRGSKPNVLCVSPANARAGAMADPLTADRSL